MFFLSCANTKSSQTVFPTTAPNAACGQMTVKNQYVVGWEDGHFSVEHGTSDSDFREKFVNKNLEKIKFIDRDIKIKIRPLSQSDVQINTDQNQWQVDQISARALWNMGERGNNIIVGVVDGMVDTTHIQIRNNIVFSKQINAEINDPSKNIHGTHVAGIIAADPSLGIASGIAPDAKIAAAQFIDNDGAGSIGEAILAMNEVVNSGAKIVNLSWGGAPCVENLKYAVNDLSNRGILVVTAAGNESTNSDISPTYPAAFMFLNQLNVAATDFNDILTSFSNYGKTSVHVAAPGKAILSTIPGNQVHPMDGTSMAAPVVSGAAALLLGAVPGSTAQQVKQALITTSDKINQNLPVQSGGRINVQKALVKLKQIVLK